jgi:hypothetical protein
VKVLREEQQRVGVDMYKGLTVANGIYALFLDADNMLGEDFMSKMIPLLTKGLFVSVLSKGVILRGWRGLYHSNQLLATLRKGLVFYALYLYSRLRGLYVRVYVPWFKRWVGIHVLISVLLRDAYTLIYCSLI